MNTADRPVRKRRLHPVARIGLFLVLTVALLFVAREIFFEGPYQKPIDQPPAGIVDMHCHTAGIGAGDSGCFVSPALRSNFRFRIYLEAFGVSEAGLREHGDALALQRISETVARSRHVRAVVVLALDGAVDAQGNLDTNRTEVHVPNDFIAAATRRHTNLLFGASINPGRVDAIERLDRAAGQGAVLVKWIPSIMGIDPADPRFVPFYERLRHHGLPLLSHTGRERSFTHARDELADPERLRLPLQHGVTVIAAHAGSNSVNEDESDFDRLRRMMREFPNLYADISALTQINKPGALRETCAAPECRGRLVYGSDFPLINTALVSAWYFPLNLTEAQQRTIAAIENPWDRDVALKQALGVSAEIFSATSRVIRLPVPR